MARTEGQWKKNSTYLTPNDNIPVVLKNDYLNFGGFIPGDIGFGIRNNAGVIEMKNAGGSWAPASAAGLSAAFETVSKNLPSADATLNYTGDDLTSIVYTNGITKTLNYTTGNLTSVVLSGTTPAGIDLTKTLSYTGDNLTGIIYS